MNCEICGNEFSFHKEDTSGLEPKLAKFFDKMQEKFIQRSICDVCNQVEYKNLKNPSCISPWESICPPLHRDTDISRLNQTVLEKANSWSYSPKGFGLVGESGKGKTRAIFQILKREHHKGKSIHYTTGTGFAHRLADLSKAKIEIDDCINADILFLDDLDKAKFTERVESSLMHVIEERNKRLKPIIFAVNASGKQLSDMFTENRSEPILRRLREFCEVHVFSNELKVVA